MSLLARPGGSIIQFVLASLPLLAVLIYMLYAASIRPDLPIYNGVEDDNASAIFPLFDMVWIFLSFFVLWTALFVYICIFIPKRRALMERYLNEGIHVLGDVYTKQFRKVPCLFTDYGYVRYQHPEEQGMMIVKRVRTFQQFAREKVTILRLADKPFSGQPLTDVEIDVASFKDNGNEARDRTRHLIWFILAWMIFTLLGPLYILHQMSLVEEVDPYERTSRGWRLFWIMVGIVVPVVAIGGNCARWMMHQHWMLERGWVVSESSVDPEASMADPQSFSFSYKEEGPTQSYEYKDDGSSQSNYRLFPEKLGRAVFKA